MINIDKSKCIKCNLCGKVCPDGIIGPGPEVSAVRNLTGCIRCGHCYAVCPTDAIMVIGFKDFCPVTLKSTPAVEAEGLMVLLKGRRSVRRYKDEPVSREHLEKIITAASVAPSATNSRIVRAYVYTDAQVIEKIARRVPDFYKKLLKLFKLPGFPLIWKMLGYPPGKLEAYKGDFRQIAEDREFKILHHTRTLLVFTAPSKDEMAVADGWIAAQNAVVYAETIPVATCYNGYLSVAANKDKGLKSLLKIPSHEYVVSALTLGYPDIEFKRDAPRKTMRTFWT
jgi:nitroreductase/NAD-dependent dihydropyrimidine dehydrogenase PreA subunit